MGTSHVWSTCAKPGHKLRTSHLNAEVEVAEGTWKFVLVELTAPGGEQRCVVRSYARLRFHAENYDRLMEGLRPLGIGGKVLGGGRIIKDSEKQTLSVYGYSKTYGRSKGCNQATADILQRANPGWAVTWTNKGY